MPTHRGLSLLLGGCGAVAALLAWHFLVPHLRPDPGGSSMAIRLGLACAALLPGVAVLALMILAQMAMRFAAGVPDPLSGHDTDLMRVNQRAITNTVEQLAIFAPSLLALAAGVPASRMAEVAALGIVFAAARLFFWLGYLAAPIGRSFGMAATLTASLGTLAAAAWAWLA